MARGNRPLSRSELPERDSRIFVLATEDQYAVKQYFSFFNTPKITVLVLETTDGKSAPEHVLERLRDIKRKHDILEGDQLWMVGDIDHWVHPGHIANFVKAVKEAGQLGVQLAFSNPCFGLWLLLHHRDLPEASVVQNCDAVEQLLRVAIGGFNKTNLQEGKFCGAPGNRCSLADLAAKRAAAADQGGDWPQKVPETHVHRLYQELRQFCSDD